MPLLSVIIPVYKHAEKLLACLKSLENQTLKDLEVIVVDDGSTDRVADRLKSYQPPFPFQFFRLSKNQGAPTARNEGFTHANGQYVIFLDADIVLIPDALEVMQETLHEHPEAAYAYPSFIFGFKTFPGRAFDPTMLKQMNYIHTSAMMRREAFPGFDPSLRKFQDWDLWLTMLERGQKGVWIDQVLFRVKTGGIMSTWLPSFAYRLPWPIFGWTPKAIRRYREAETLIRRKHAL